MTMYGCFFRIGTLLNLAFNSFDSSLDTVQAFFCGQIALGCSLGEGSRKIGYGDFALPDAQTLRLLGKGDLAHWAPEGLGEIQIFQTSVFNSYNLSLKQGCPNLYHLEVEAGGFIYLPSGKSAA